MAALINDTDNALHWMNPDTGAKGAFATEEDSVDGDPWECADGRYIVFSARPASGAREARMFGAPMPRWESEATVEWQAGQLSSLLSGFALGLLPG